MLRRTLTCLALFAATACADINVDDGEAATQICLPNAGRCINGDTQVEVCNSDGTTFLFALECKDTEKCDAATCVPQNGAGTTSCAANSLRCAPDGAAVQVCTNNTWMVREDCAGRGCTDWTCNP